MDDQLYKINRVTGIMKLAIEAGFREDDMDTHTFNAITNMFDLIVKQCAERVEKAAWSKSEVHEFEGIKNGSDIVRAYGYSIGQK